MALNPPISQGGLPLQVEGEVFVLLRHNMEIEVKIDTHKQFGQQTGLGTMYLTSCRIVFVNKDFSTNSFKSFDIPLALLSQQSFEQPVFGSNYLAGQVQPLYNLLPGPAQFKLWFKSGGANTFLKFIQNLLNQIRQNNRKGPDPQFIEQIRSGNIGSNSALIDPEDPSVIYVTQPDTQFNGSNPNYYGTNIYQGYAPPPPPPPQNNFYAPPPPPPNYGYQVQNAPPPNNNNFYAPPPPPPSNYGAPPPPNNSYGVPPPNNNYGAPPSNDNYGAPPPSNNNFGAPPPSNNYGAPPPSNNSYGAPPPNNYGAPPPNYNNNYGAPPPNNNYNQAPPPNNQIPMGQPIGNQQQAPPPPPPPQQPNQGYYFGFWGPQLQKNDR